MTPTELASRTQRALDKRGLDLCEHFVMCCAQVESPTPKDVFCRFAMTLAQNDSRGQFTVEEFDAAFARLVARRLLVVITTDDLQHLEDPSVRLKYHLDDVDFSQEGHEIHRIVLEEIYARPVRKTPFRGVKR
jgi:hypothetical protein